MSPFDRITPLRATVCAAITASCWGIAYAADSPVEIRAVGADSMRELMACWTAAFEEIEPSISIQFRAGFSADGAAAMIHDEAELSPFAREYFPAEIQAFEARFGALPTLVEVAVGSFASNGKTHAIAIYVNKNNPIEGISLQQLAHIYTGKDPMYWGELGVLGELADEAVRPVGMLNRRSTGNPPGIVNFLENRLSGEAAFSDRIIQMTGATGAHPLEEIVSEVAADPAAIGYSGFQFATEGVRTIPVSWSDDQAFIEGTPGSVAATHYPLSRTIYIGKHPDMDTETAQAADAFLLFVASEGGQACVETNTLGFLTLPIHRRTTSLQSNSGGT